MAKKKSPDNWKFTQREYETAKAEFFKERHGVDDWAEWSLKPQSPRDIMLRTLISQETDTEYLCFSYVCGSSELPEGLLDDIIFVQSGFFNFASWNWKDEIVKQVIEILCSDDILREVKKVVDGDVECPEIKTRCEEMLEAFHKAQEVALARELTNLNKSIRYAVEAKELLAGKNWVDDFDLVQKTVAHMWKCARISEQVARTLEKYRREYAVTNRIDWKTLHERKKLTKEYRKARSRVIYIPAREDDNETSEML